MSRRSASGRRLRGHATRRATAGSSGATAAAARRLIDLNSPATPISTWWATPTRSAWEPAPAQAAARVSRPARRARVRRRVASGSRRRRSRDGARDARGGARDRPRLARARRREPAVRLLRLLRRVGRATDTGSPSTARASRRPAWYERFELDERSSTSSTSSPTPSTRRRARPRARRRPSTRCAPWEPSARRAATLVSVRTRRGHRFVEGGRRWSLATAPRGVSGAGTATVREVDRERRRGLGAAVGGVASRRRPGG